MFAGKKKTGAVLNFGKSENRILRLFRAGSGFRAYNVGSERIVSQEPQNDDNRESANPLLRAENLRGKAEMNNRNTRSFC